MTKHYCEHCGKPVRPIYKKGPFIHTVEGIAEYLGFNKKKVAALIASDQLKVVKVANVRCASERQLLHFMETGENLHG